MKLSLLLLAVFVTGCATNRTVTFSSQELGSELGLVSLDNLEGAALRLKNPAVVNIKNLNTRAVKIAAAGKTPMFWLAPDELGDRTEIKIKKLPTCSGNDVNRNRPLRLIMKAYQALYSKDYTLARELAGKAAEIDSALSAPHIITGLSYFQQGKRDEARVAFTKANALDPEDQEIVQLLKMVP